MRTEEATVVIESESVRADADGQEPVSLVAP
jgi:hypothetical protein